MSGLQSGFASGIASSLPSGIETPDTMLNLRKASESEQPRQLYQVRVFQVEGWIASVVMRKLQHSSSQRPSSGARGPQHGPSFSLPTYTHPEILFWQHLSASLFLFRFWSRSKSQWVQILSWALITFTWYQAVQSRARRIRRSKTYGEGRKNKRKHGGRGQ